MLTRGAGSARSSPAGRVRWFEDGRAPALRIRAKWEGGAGGEWNGTTRIRWVAARVYLPRHGRPQHPSELLHHECLGYTSGGQTQGWQFIVDGQPETFPVRSRIHANNGEVLTEAAALGLGITLQPDFIVAGFLAAARVEPILGEFPIPELGIYAMLPSNRHVSHRVRAVSYTHLPAHETALDLVCRLLLAKKQTNTLHRVQ